MCFHIRNNKKDATLYEALEDITCYKILEVYSYGLFSPYHNYRYELNKLVKSKLRLPRNINENGEYQFKIDSFYFKALSIEKINKGLHSYINLKQAKKRGKRVLGILVVVIYLNVL